MLSFVFISYSQEKGTYKDLRNGKIYKTVKIGTQTWMAENYAYTPDSGNYWAYENIQSNVAKYGYLYDWEAANKFAPKGWHLPTKAEADTLISYLNRVYQQKAFEASISGGTSGFNAMFGGSLEYGIFKNNGYVGFWTSSKSIIFTDAVFIYSIGLSNIENNIFLTNTNTKNGSYVRLIKD